MSQLDNNLPNEVETKFSCRDDLTVEVIFFGESDQSGNVVLNPEASASDKAMKAKL